MLILSTILDTKEVGGIKHSIDNSSVLVEYYSTTLHLALTVIMHLRKSTLWVTMGIETQYCFGIKKTPIKIL